MTARKKIKIKANRLKEAEAHFISLVSRGANQIPFRITKSEAPMLGIDLSRIFKGSDAPKAEVAAIVVKSGVDMDAAKAVLSKLGFKTDAITEEQNTGFILKQADVEGPSTVMKISDDIAVVMVNVSKAFTDYNYQTTDFMALMAQEGFLPTLCLANDKIEGVLSNIIFQSMDPQMAAELAGKAIDDYKAFVVGLLEAIPAVAFKLDTPEVRALTQVEKKQEPYDPSMDPTKKGKAQAAKDQNDIKATKEKDKAMSDAEKNEAKATQDATGKTETEKSGGNVPSPEVAGAAAPTGDSGADGSATADIGKDTNGQVPAPAGFETVKKMLEEMFASFKSGVDTSLSEVQKSVAQLSERLGKTEQLAKSADEAVNGVVAAKAPGDVSAEKGKVESKKSEGFMFLDTAYGRPD